MKKHNKPKLKKVTYGESTATVSGPDIGNLMKEGVIRISEGGITYWPAGTTIQCKDGV